MKTFAFFFLFGCFTAVSLNANALSILRMNDIEREKTLNSQYDNTEVVNSLLRSYESTFRFKVNKMEVENKKDEKCEVSSEFKLNEVTWKVKVCKRLVTEIYEGGKKMETGYASVELESVFTGETATWSCNAEVDVKLIAIKNGVKDKCGKIVSSTYSKRNSVHRFEKFIKWEKLNENYLEHEMGTFVFSIKTNALNRPAKLEQTKAKFHLRVKQAESLSREYSNELVVRGIRWKVLTQKENDYLGIYVEANENDIDTDSKWSVTANIKLLSTKAYKTKERKFTDHTFDWTNTAGGFPKFLEWSEFTKADNGFIRNNVALELQLCLYFF